MTILSNFTVEITNSQKMVKNKISNIKWLYTGVGSETSTMHINMAYRPYLCASLTTKYYLSTRCLVLKSEVTLQIEF